MIFTGRLVKKQVVIWFRGEKLINLLIISNASIDE